MASDTTTSSSSPPPQASDGGVRRKQLKEGMEHLRGIVTVKHDSSDSPITEPSMHGNVVDDESRRTTEIASGGGGGGGGGESAAGADAYGIPSTLATVRRPRDSRHPPENELKRSDPFQFGSRYLGEDDDIFAFNAWDHVETDEAYRSFAAECYERQRKNPVSDFDRRRFNETPEKQWNKFYANNTANFFKDRKWLRQEFPVLSEVMSKGAGRKVVLEVGAGAGNTAFPIIKNNENEELEVWACDFSATAVGVIREHEEYTSPAHKGKIEAKVWDVAAVDTCEQRADQQAYSLPDGLEAGSVDILIMIFIFSALAPEQWQQAVRNAWHALRPGGVVLFRDYGRGDLAQVRFKKERWMGENFYVRGDGTRVYFFEEEELRRVWGSAFQVISSGVDRRMLVNRQRRLKMYRCWVQAVFSKPVDASDFPNEIVTQQLEHADFLHSSISVSTEAEVESMTEQAGTMSMTDGSARG